MLILTDDSATTAKAVPAKLGINEVEADVLPAVKTKSLNGCALSAGWSRWRVMASTTRQHSPLAAADVGIAMGAGTDVAQQSAGVTLLSGDLNGIVRARALSAATMSNIRQNLFFAFIYNAVGVPILRPASYIPGWASRSRP